MKKFIALVAAALLSATAVFAENTLHLGMYFPLTKLNFDDDDVFSSGFGGSLDYTHVAEGGFTWKIGAGFAAISSDDLWDDAEGIDLDLGLGFGWSFIHNEKMTLSLTGDIGLRIQGFDQEIDYMVGNTKVGSTEYDFDSTLFYIGPEVNFTYRFTNHFGAFANFGIFYAKGSAEQEGKTKISVAGYEAKADEWSDDASTWGFIFQPKLGLSWTF